MFKVNEYKIVFKRVWHERSTDINGLYVYGSGRYDTVCEIYVESHYVAKESPRFTGVAKLHPNDKPDKIVGKKIALRNAIGLVKSKDQPFLHFSTLQQQDAFSKKKVRTAIWEAFFAWVVLWSIKEIK